jgi:hypothetical protein
MKWKFGIGLFMVTLLIATCAAQNSCIAPSCSKCPSIELNDRNATQRVTAYDVRDYRYAEIIVSCPGVPSGIWNTMAMNNMPGYPNDSCPPNLFANYSNAAVEKQYGASKVFMNGPRYWTMDAMSVNASTIVRNLAGLDTRWGADIAAEQGNLNYVPTNVTCNRTWFFAKGKPVFLLDAPNDYTFVMQSYSLLVDKNLTYKDLPTLGSKLALPAGWRYRTKVLDQDLAINGITADVKPNQWVVTQDSLQNTYSACWKSGSQSSCNIQP